MTAAAFLDGLTRPRLSTALGMLAFAALQIGALTAWLTPERLALMPAGVLMRHTDDDGAAISIRALQMVYTPNPDARPLVVVTGASSLREALVDETGLASDLSAAVGGASADTFRVYDLCTSGQELSESLALLSAVPDDAPGVRLVGIGPLRLLRTPAEIQDRMDHPNLALPRAMLDGPAAALGATLPTATGALFIDQLQFFVSRPQIPLRYVLGPTALRRHRYLGETPWTADRMAEVTGELRGRAISGAEVGEKSLVLMADVLGRLTAGGRRTVVVLEPPQSPQAAPALADIDTTWRPKMQAVAARAGALYWNLDAEAGLTTADFHDYTHLGRREAMERYQRALAARLAPYLRKSMK